MYLTADMMADDPVAIVVEENPAVEYQQQLQHPHQLQMSGHSQQQLNVDQAYAHPQQPHMHQASSLPYHFQMPLQQQLAVYHAESPRAQELHVQTQNFYEMRSTQPQLQAALGSSQPSPCADCQLQIKDRFYLLVADRCWHVDCLQCSVCKRKLESHVTCYSRDGMIYCKDDYYQQFCKRCGRCNRVLSPKELVMRAKEYIYHMHCFNCVVCACALQPGEYFALAPTGLLYCRYHYEPLFCGVGAIGKASPSLDETGFGGASPAAQSTGKNNSVKEQPQAKNGGQKGRPRKKKNLVPAPVAETEQNQGGDACILTQPELNNVAHHHLSHLQQAQTINVHQQQHLANAGELMLTAVHCQTGNAQTASNGAGNRSSPSLHHHHHHLSQQQQQARSKRMRTSFKHHQLRAMKMYFALNHNPDAKDLKQLAQKTGLTKRVLQVWFQNARAKYRRSLQSKHPHSDPQQSQHPSQLQESGTSANSSDAADLNLSYPADRSTPGEDSGCGIGGTVSVSRWSTESAGIDLHSSDSSKPCSEHSSPCINENKLFSRENVNAISENEYFSVSLRASIRRQHLDTSPSVSISRRQHSPVGDMVLNSMKTSSVNTVCYTNDQQHVSSPVVHHMHSQAVSLNDDDSASKTLADYFQQCEGSLL